LLVATGLEGRVVTTVVTTTKGLLSIGATDKIKKPNH
jgi:hypothetical protein